MTLIWLKLAHIVAVSVWAGGLLALPLLMAAPVRTIGPDTLRHFYIGWLSPAAFVAILSGGLLAAEGGVHDDWFASKLALVGLFALIHILVARRIAGGPVRPPLLLRSMAATAGALALAILWVVLAKPGAALAFPCDGAGELRLLVLSLQGEASSSCLSTASP